MILTRDGHCCLPSSQSWARPPRLFAVDFPRLPSAPKPRSARRPGASGWKWFIPFAIGFVIAYPAIVIATAGFGRAVKWIDNFGIQILIYVMLGWGLNIVVGLAGLLDLGYVAFYAVGAYSYALLAKTFGLSFWILLPLAGILASFWGIMLGFPVLRLRGDYLAIVTLAFGEIIRIVLINWVDLTNGYAGITGIPRPTFFGIPFNADDDGFAAVFGLEFSPDLPHDLLYYLILALALLTAFVTCACAACRSAAPGRRCARTKSPAVRSASTPPTPSSPPSRWAPCLRDLPARSSRRGRASSRPTPSHSWNRPRSSSIVVLGGMGSQIGVAIAAIAMIGGTEIMRELDFLKLIFGRRLSIRPSTACCCSASPWC